MTPKFSPLKTHHSSNIISPKNSFLQLKNSLKISQRTSIDKLVKFSIPKEYLKSNTKCIKHMCLSDLKIDLKNKIAFD